MAGLDPAIHVFMSRLREDVDARHKAGHDENNYWLPDSPGNQPRYASGAIEPAASILNAAANSARV
jgi:hypothetical protein